MIHTETKNPLVSIIIVTYNSSKYVIETLESAKCQSYKNIELIVTDDCSIDNTIEICANWIQKNKDNFVNVELVSNETNTGIAANCNRGIAKAKGEWLKFIAGDDILMENCILDNLSFAEVNNDAKFITSKMQKIDEDSELMDFQDSIYNAYEEYYFNKPALKQIKIYARLPLFLNSPAFFIKKEAIISAGYFDEEFKIYDDICLIFKMNSINIKIFYLDKITVNYRIHTNAISRSCDSFIVNRRNEEQILIFKKYRQKHLNILNLIDLSVYYEMWLNYKFKGFLGYKAKNILHRFSFFYWHLKYLKLKLNLRQHLKNRVFKNVVLV